MTEGPYKLPEGWRWVRLGEVARREAVLLRPSDYPSQRFRYLGMEHVAAGQWEAPEGVEVNGQEIKSQVVAFKPGLVLYGKLRPYLNKVVVPCYEGVASTEFVPIAPDPGVLDAEYLGAFLRTPSFVSYAVRNTTGSRQPRTRLEALWSALVPLPPLPEQRRIVARIEELMSRMREAKRLRQQAEEDAERLWQSVLAETFPRPGSDLPEGWRWVRLGEVCEVWDTLRKPVKKKDRIPGDVPYCGANGIIDYVDGYTHAGEFVLLAEDGGFYGPGEPTAYIMSGRFWANNHVHILRGRPDHLVNQLLYYCLVAYDLRPFLTGATRPKLTQAAMRSIPIPLPPLDEQRWIVAHLEAVQEKVRALKEAQAETDEELKRLERSILDKAFRGEL